MTEQRHTATGHVYATMRIVLVCATAVLLFGLSLRPLLEEDYRHPGLAVCAFAVLAGVTGACSWWALRRRPLPVALMVTGTLLVLAAATAATVAVSPERRFQAPDWSFGLAGWYVLLLLLDRVRVLVTVLAAHTAMSAGLFLIAGTPDRAALGAAGAATFSAVSVQLAVVVITGVLCGRSREAAEAAEERDRLLTRMLAAHQWRERQRHLFAAQLGTVLPLLAALADEVTDPRDEDTRRQCALTATQLRRLFAQNDDVPDPLVHEVTACVDVAERRGVDVSFAVSGAAVELPLHIRQELTGPLVTALSAARRRARVSVLRTEEEVRIAVIADARAVAAATSTGPVEVEYGRYGQFQRLETRWRK
ncbi:hypothetical protein [Streptomyces sp. IB2014 016-6]|uniref:hypothetical protein n=1 Tax=Streptomyces sp. IB2014 016-6 TaxID=2517818 RepID=UPI001F4F3EFA|nr:hypothetical protein [Streptomyces sp. IB2014 016-6]